MQINNILNCSKPRRLNSFVGNLVSKDSNGKKSYKHYEQMSDDVLSYNSIVKAHKTVDESGKMKLHEAMPWITTALIGTSLALTQPGKLATKAKTGLGFLALTHAVSGVLDTVSNTVDNKYVDTQNTNNKRNKAFLKVFASLGSLAALSFGAGMLLKNSQKFADKFASPVSNFIKKETAQLKNEVNSTKLAKFVDNKINPFLEKHKKGTRIVGNTLPFGLIALGSAMQMKLANSLSNDVKKEANKNFVKGKLIQEIARKDFNNIDAIEV